MKTFRTSIVIDALPQTVWSILDDLDRYPEWNSVLPQIAGRTTVGGAVDAIIKYNGLEQQTFHAKLTRLVGARELRWVSEVPSEPPTLAEHFFCLTPTEKGQTHLDHGESFEGPMADMIWSIIGGVAGADYDEMNRALKKRAEAVRHTPMMLHPMFDAACSGDDAERIDRLTCRCGDSPVKISINSEIRHSHLCGCSQCWKPKGALFAFVGVAPAEAVSVSANQDKLAVVDVTKEIHRYACTVCGAHMVGRVENADHHFFGLSFVHPELATGGQLPRPEFAGFVSSIIETGLNPTMMAVVRAKLQELQVPAFDAFSSELMDLIAWHRVKMRRYS